MITYHMSLINGVSSLDVDQLGTSASDAMQRAIELHIGFKVATCFSGPKANSAMGRIHYEVPSHSALQKKPVKVHAKASITDSMFDEAKIVSDSEYARAAMARRSL